MSAMCGGASEEEMRASYEKLRQTLAGDHVLAVMIREHDAILGFLDRLERLNQDFQQIERFDKAVNQFAEFREIARRLLDAEPHHQREERVLFPRLEAQGIYGPTHVMRAEHEDLREGKHRLQELGETPLEREFIARKKEIDSVSRFLITCLRSHILRENYILYPMSARAIRDSQSWEAMKSEATAIGDCSFTPPA